MTGLQPAHRDLAAFAADLLGDHGATLFGDREQRLEQRAPLSATLDHAGLVGARQRIENGFDDRDAPLLLAQDRVHASQQTHQLEDGLRHQRRAVIQQQLLLALGTRAADGA